MPTLDVAPAGWRNPAPVNVVVVKLGVLTDARAITGPDGGATAAPDADGGTAATAVAVPVVEIRAGTAGGPAATTPGLAAVGDGDEPATTGTGDGVGLVRTVGSASSLLTVDGGVVDETRGELDTSCGAGPVVARGVGVGVVKTATGVVDAAPADRSPLSAVAEPGLAESAAVGTDPVGADPVSTEVVAGSAAVVDTLAGSVPVGALAGGSSASVDAPAASDLACVSVIDQSCS